MEHVLGIDLGTTNSCVAAVEDDLPQVIASKGGYRTMPSIVAQAQNGRRLVGHLAKRQMVTNPENTIYAAKRLIGRKWTSEFVQSALPRMTYRLLEGPHNDVRIRLRDQEYSVPEISAMVLTEMRAVAEEHFEAPCPKAVITVPAYFNDGQRQDTKNAGRIAGLDVLRIINEPTAAALAYGYGKRVDRRVAVFDLGGGTFDISILDIESGVFEVLATAGDTFLGGEDFDHRVSDWLERGFIEETKIDAKLDAMALQRMKDSAEKAKCELSFHTEAEINLPFLYSSGRNQTYHLQKVLRRSLLEELCGDLVERTIAICARTLKDAGLAPADIDDVILVGGQSRMPLVQRQVALFFGREPSKNVHPDEAVAMGAAIQGHALVTADQPKKAQPLLLDVTPHSLGVMIVGGFFQTIIEKNTTIPTSASHVFTTVKEGQTNVRVMVFQGESRKAKDNELMGEFLLTGLREAHRGEVKVEITFEISADGIVSASAKDLETGRQQSIVVTATSGLTEAELQAMVEHSSDDVLAAAEDQSFETLRSDAERLVGELSQLQLAVGGTGKAATLPGLLKRVEKARKAMQRAIDVRDLGALGSVVEELQVLKNAFKSLLNHAT